MVSETTCARAELEALGRRAAACGWQWLPGTLDHVGYRIRGTGASRLGCWPDFSDPATLGCLLALVREKWGPDAHLVRFDTHVTEGGRMVPAKWWALAVGDSTALLILTVERCYYLAGPTEAAALVAALEAPRD